MIFVNKVKMTLKLERGLPEEAKVVTELARHWDERSGAGRRKVRTGVVPQALFAPQRMNVKIFKLNDMSIFCLIVRFTATPSTFL